MKRGGGGGRRLKYNNVDGDMPLYLRKTERKSKGGSSSNESEKDDKSKVMSGSKDLYGDSARKRNDDLSCYRRILDQCTQVKELKKWFASSKATDG